MYLSEDSVAVTLICSNLAISKTADLKPYTITEWNVLANKLINSSIKKPANLLKSTREEIEKTLYLNSYEVDRLLELLSRGANFAIEVEELMNKGIRIITRADKEYPAKFKSKLKKKSPPVLYYSGDITLLKTEGIAIVGSRDIEDRALEFTKKLARKAAAENLTIFSGGARGVDSVAETESLNNGGKAVSFVADGLAKKLKKKEVREMIIRKQLLLLSSHHPNTSFQGWIAMERNKYVYTLSSASFVISSAYNKGGTWAGATENIKNHWVKLFVRKEVSLKGNEELIKIGGIPIEEKVFGNEDFKLKKFIKDSEMVGKNEEVDINQVTIFDVQDRIKNNEKISTCESLNNECDKSENVYNQNDVYNMILPILKSLLKEARKSEEIAEMLNVGNGQMEIWIHRAIEDRVIEKFTKRPITYKCL